MPEELKSPGLVADPRTSEQKEMDYPHGEVAPAAIVLNWKRGIEGAPTYSLRDQNGSGSCVGQAGAKALEILTGVIQSAHPIYRRRANFAGFGMWLQDAGNIVKNLGTTTEEKDPSQRMTEEQMNAPVAVETPLKGFLYAFPNVYDIDKIAEAIEVRKHCIVTVGFTLDEYVNAEKPVYNGKPATDYHALCGVYYFTDEKGEKCILIDESWGPNNIKRRVFTESYLKARGTGAMYFIPPAPPVEPQKPHFNFSSPLQYGMSNYSVKALQDILKYEQIFPANVSSTGYYGPITAKAVLAFQRKYQVAPESELVALAGKYLGPKTRKKLNELYAQ